MNENKDKLFTSLKNDLEEELKKLQKEKQEQEKVNQLKLVELRKNISEEVVQTYEKNKSELVEIFEKKEINLKNDVERLINENKKELAKIERKNTEKVKSLERGQAPYQQVLSHGFVVDEKGHKMSKSLVISSDFTKEVKISIPILENLRESYQKIRNTLRFLLGNLANLPPEIKNEQDLEANLDPVDYYLLHKLEKLIAENQKNYNEYNFNPTYSSLLNFCINDLSSFYFEISKDSLYCDNLHSLRRKQIITTLYYLLAGLLKIISPILPFLAEEVYQNLPFNFGFAGQASVHLLKYSNAKIPSNNEENIAIITNFLLPLRQVAYQALEKARQAKIIDTNSQASLEIYLKEEKKGNYSEFNLEELLLVSEVEINEKEETDTLKERACPSRTVRAVLIKKTPSLTQGSLWVLKAIPSATSVEENNKLNVVKNEIADIVVFFNREGEQLDEQKSLINRNNAFDNLQLIFNRLDDLERGLRLKVLELVFVLSEVIKNQNNNLASAHAKVAKIKTAKKDLKALLELSIPKLEYDRLLEEKSREIAELNGEIRDKQGSISYLESQLIGLEISERELKEQLETERRDNNKLKEIIA
ncbi:13098_t:CDS:2, partial [Funneliformis geosporum]